MIVNLVITIIVAASVSFFLTPRLIRFCRNRQILDKPSARRKHTKPTPRLGGVAVFLGFLFAIIISLPFLNQSLSQYPSYVFMLMGIVIASGLCFIMGLFDDLYDLKPSVKFALQVAIALSLVFFGVQIGFITKPGDGMIFLPMWISIVITVFWVVAVMNAINLSDGLDGLAGGISLIAGIVFLAIALMRSDPIKAEIPAFLSAAMIGAIIGFLPYNFPKARIFLGDSGSQLLGFLLAAISIVGAFKGPALIAIAIPIIVLGIPLLDTSLAILRRSVNGKKIYEADDEHIHHTLVKKGLKPYQAVLILCAITAVLGAVAWTVAGCG